MPPTTNDHSASDDYDENRLVTFNIPILPSNNYGANYLQKQP